MILDPSIFHTANDEQLVNHLAEWITNRYKKIRLVDLTPQEKTIMVVITAQGIIGNGGFQYLFESDFEDGANYTEIIDALNRISERESAQIVQNALNLFPNAIPQKDIEERYQYLTTLYETHPKLEQQLDEQFWKRDKQITKALASYIREHQENFLRHDTG